jgi:DNA-directed RNA polymerase subunit RPC12/RpoP
MITLCPTTFETASKMKNFSGWVRKELMKLNAIEEEKEQNYTRYRCPACWKVFIDKHEWGEMTCMNKDCGYTHKLEAME